MATPLFRQGAKPSAKLFLYSIVCICLILIDSRVQSLTVIRQTIGTVLYPLQKIMLVPQSAVAYVASWTQNTTELSKRANQLAQESNMMAQRSQQYLSVKAENEQLRKLLALRMHPNLTTIAADILYETREPTIRKLIIDRGSVHGVQAGMPIMDSYGLLGQITRVFPLVAEVNLIIDKDQATPVHAIRNGLRAVAYGGIPGGMLELRFMAGNADIQEGDELYTSGIDGIYPADLPVAKVLKIDRSSAFGFARIVCQPLAGVMHNRQIAIITNKLEIPALPTTDAEDFVKDKHTSRSSDKKNQSNTN
jgi:rod shape-determining protein MreC